MHKLWKRQHSNFENSEEITYNSKNHEKTWVLFHLLWQRESKTNSQSSDPYFRELTLTQPRRLLSQIDAREFKRRARHGDRKLH